MQLRFNVLDFAQPSRSGAPDGSPLWREAGSPSNGDLIINAQSFRTQQRNRADALERLIELIREAARPPRAAAPATRPTLAPNCGGWRARSSAAP